MKKLTAFAKRIRLGKIVAVFLVGVLLMASTACSSVSAKTSDQVREDMPSGRMNSTYEGGMNSYPDVDPRRDTSAATSQAKELINRTERQVIDQTGSVGGNTERILEKKGDNLKHWGENAVEDAASLPAKAKNAAEDFAEGTRKGTDNIQDNLEGANKDLSRTSNKVQSKAQRATQNVLDDASDLTD